MESSTANLCVFETSGRISLASEIIVKANKILACQTAPNKGVIITNSGFRVEGGNVRIEHCEIMNGDEAFGRAYEFRRGLTISSASGGQPVDNVIVQNSAIAWGIDENMSSGAASGVATSNLTYYRNFIFDALL